MNRSTAANIAKQARSRTAAYRRGQKAYAVCAAEGHLDPEAKQHGDQVHEVCPRCGTSLTIRDAN